MPTSLLESPRRRDRQPAAPSRSRRWTRPTSARSSRSSAGRARRRRGRAPLPVRRPDVVETAPRLADGTPFPTPFYLTCPRLTGAIGTLETSGVMREMTERLGDGSGARAPLSGRAPGLPARGAARSARAGDRRHLGRRDADAGQVPARAGRRTRWRPVPGSTRSATRRCGAAAVVGAWVRAPDAAEDRQDDRDARGGDRLRHQLDPAARRRRRPVPTASLIDVVRRMEIVRLGQGVDRTGRLAAEALERTIAVAGDYAAQCATLGAERVRFVATSASRDAAQPRRVRRRRRADVLGVAPEVVTGDEEARLSFAGATRELPARGARRRTSSSTSAAARPSSCAAPRRRGGAVGRHRLRPADRAAPAQRPADGRARSRPRPRDVDAALDRVEPKSSSWPASATVVGLAGSVTTVAAVALGLPAYDPTRIHRACCRSAQVARRATDAAARDPRGAGGAAVHAPRPGRRHRRRRAGAGDAVLERVRREAGMAEVVVSEHDILDGIACSLA